MPVIVDYPLSATFTGVNSLQAMGVGPAGNDYPNGIPGALGIVGGAMLATVRDTDPVTFVGQRAEITAPADSVGERWYMWEFMVGDDWSGDTSMSLMQIHDTPDGGDATRFPNFLFTLDGDHHGVFVPSAMLPTESAGSKKVGTSPLVRNVWRRACLHVSWQTTAIGFREFFLDEVPLFREFNVPTHYVDAVGPYLKVGVYDAFHVGGFGTKSARFRNVKVWSGNDGYSTVMGKVPTAQTGFQLL